jgi:hypothetical protein
MLLFVIPLNSLGMEEALPSRWRKEINNNILNAIRAPEKDTSIAVKHATTAAISFEKKISDTESIVTNYISDWNYVAKESSFLSSSAATTKPLWVPSTLSHAERSIYLPLPHSEIAFLQQITGHKDPANHIQGFIYYLLSKHSGETLTIYLKNSGSTPCSTGDWGPGIYCKNYLQSFCNKIKTVYGNCCILIFINGVHRDSYL